QPSSSSRNGAARSAVSSSADSAASETSRSSRYASKELDNGILRKVGPFVGDRSVAAGLAERTGGDAPRGPRSVGDRGSAGQRKNPPRRVPRTFLDIVAGDEQGRLEAEGGVEPWAVGAGVEDDHAAPELGEVDAEVGRKRGLAGAAAAAAGGDHAAR